MVVAPKALAQGSLVALSRRIVPAVHRHDSNAPEDPQPRSSCKSAPSPSNEFVKVNGVMHAVLLHMWYDMQRGRRFSAHVVVIPNTHKVL